MDRNPQPHLPPFSSFSPFLINNPNSYSCSTTSRSLPPSTSYSYNPSSFPGSFDFFCGFLDDLPSRSDMSPSLTPLTSSSTTFLNDPLTSSSTTVLNYRPSYSSFQHTSPPLTPSYSSFLDTSPTPTPLTSSSTTFLNDPITSSFTTFLNNPYSSYLTTSPLYHPSTSYSDKPLFTSFESFFKFLGNLFKDEYDSSLSSSSSSSLFKSLSMPQWKYDVFVSFRGEDTRKTFTSHLFHAFTQANITFFKDNDADGLGYAIEKILIEAIHNSRIALVVFSKNYAESRWCLNELAEILECNKKRKEHHLFIPIFYDVEPGDVRKVTGSIRDGFTKCLEKHKFEPESLFQKWRDALVDAGNLLGFHLKNDANGNESKLIDKITRKLSKELGKDLLQQQSGGKKKINHQLKVLYA